MFLYFQSFLPMADNPAFKSLIDLKQVVQPIRHSPHMANWLMEV